MFECDPLQPFCLALTARAAFLSAYLYFDEDWITKGLSFGIVSLPGTAVHASIFRRCEEDPDGCLRSAASRVQGLFDGGSQVGSGDQLETVALVPIASAAILYTPTLIQTFTRRYLRAIWYAQVLNVSQGIGAGWCGGRQSRLGRGQILEGCGSSSKVRLGGPTGRRWRQIKICGIFPC